MARFTETEQIRPASTFRFDTSSLTARLDSFAAQQAQIGAQKVAEQAYTRGQQAFAEGEQPEFKKEGFFGKIPAKAYNEGLRAAYVASIDRDNREEIARITAENPNNLAAYNDQVEAYRAATLNNVDPTARDVVSGSLDSLISSNRIKVQNNEIAKTHKENAREVSNQIEAATDDALGFARDDNAESSAESALAAFMGIQSRVAMGDISDAEAATQQRNLDRAITEEFKLGELVRTFDDEGEQAAFTRLDELSGKRPGGFAPDEWDSFISRAQSRLAQKRSRLGAERKESSELALKALKDFEKANALGFDVKPSEVQRVENLVAGNPQLESRFNISNNVRSFSVMSTSDRNAILKSAQTGELADVDEFAAMNAANNEIPIPRPAAIAV